MCILYPIFILCQVQEDLDGVNGRSTIHRNGLEFFLDYINNAFIKGWEIYRERTLDQVSFPLYWLYIPTQSQ